MRLRPQAHNQRAACPHALGRGGEGGRHASIDEGPVMNARCHETVRSLVWMVRQTRPDIANAVRGGCAGLACDPKEVLVHLPEDVHNCS